MDEIIEQQLFEIKSKFLRAIPHPRLIRKAMEQVKAMDTKTDAFFEAQPKDFNELALGTALTLTTEEVLKLKLAVSGSVDPAELYNNLGALYAVQWALLTKLASYLPEQDTYPDETIKQSDPVDSYEIWRFISKLALAENEIKPYICDSVTGKVPADFDVLTIACLRSRKIITNE